MIPDFTPGPQHEKPMDDLDKWSHANFLKLPQLIQDDCVNLLRDVVPHSLQDLWKEQYARGVSTGSDDPWFHHGAGMWVRNQLRGMLLDEELPAVAYPEGGEFKNWDDYYHGAIIELVK